MLSQWRHRLLRVDDCNTMIDKMPEGIIDVFHSCIDNGDMAIIEDSSKEGNTVIESGAAVDRQITAFLDGKDGAALHPEVGDRRGGFGKLRVEAAVRRAVGNDHDVIGSRNPVGRPVLGVIPFGLFPRSSSFPVDGVLGLEGCANTYRKYQDDQLFHSELDYRVIGDIWVPVIFPGHDKVQKKGWAVLFIFHPKPFISEQIGQVGRKLSGMNRVA